MGNRRGGAVILLVFLIAIGALYGGYYYFQKTPRYALIQFKRAIVFKDPEIAEKFLDMDNFINRFMGEASGGGDKESLKKRIIYEINWPDQKSTFASVKNWSVFTVPIQINVDNNEYATTKPDADTQVTLEKTSEGHWIITSIKFNKPQ
jgi:hypothetical protein